jgi:hypothetical protein
MMTLLAKMTRARTPWLSGTCFGLRVALLVTGLAAVSGCGPGDQLRFRLADDVVRPPRSVVIIAADGVDHPTFMEFLEKGELPNIRRVFVDGGVSVEHAFNCLPTVTYANFPSLITGRFPAHHGILGNLWLDRHTLESTYYLTLGTYLDVNDHLEAPTIYEILSDHFTANLQTHTRQGVNVAIENSLPFMLSWAMGNFTDADRAVLDTFPMVERVANRVKRWPSIIFTYHPGIDAIGHRFGPDSPQYADALRNIDFIVGQISDAVSREGLDDRTSFVFLSDHGMVPVEPGHHFDLKKWLRSAHGLRVRDRPIHAKTYYDRFKAYQRYDAFLVIGSDRRAQLHLKGDRGWAYTVDPEEIDAFVTRSPRLYEQPGVDCVLMSAGRDKVRVRSRNGVALIERQWEPGGTRYRLRIEGGDPLGYLDDPGLAAFLAEGWHDSRAWLEATAQTERPDFVPQAAELFDSSRSGELVVFAAEDWDFGGRWKAGHGSCMHRDMRVPLYFAGPDLPNGASISYGRLVDMMPTILGLLDEAHRLERLPPIDGIDMSDQLRTADRIPAEPVATR